MSISATGIMMWFSDVDENGNTILMFLGKADEKGVIKGDRYSRTLVYDSEGKLIKDHWERKGKAS